ncbi:hypothetical protein PM082_020886 [Marasmius tenuissimus]|nr:hypothetical protein PM082_020886 [Marasmius tenuissimus]
MSIRNSQTGSGWQYNNTHSGTQNIAYGGGEVNFVYNFNTTAPNPHKDLWEEVAKVGASHRAEHQFSRGECFEGTRERALGTIYDWASAKGPEALPIYWLSGAAGVGKSAIALTIAKSCEAAALLASSFFFFRSDSKRNNPSALVLTIAYELATTTPLMRNCIEQRISTDPRILKASLEEQFRELITVPALMWSKQRIMWGVPAVPNIVIIDGLDECGDEDTQTRVLSIIKTTYQRTPHFPLRFLICSRPEAWISDEFSDGLLLQLSETIVLDDSLEARNDIRRYYIHHFREVTTSRKYAHVQFPNPWPSERDLGILVERSCAQFVYASTTVRFIKLAYTHPIVQLRTILDSTTERRLSRSPYHDLDCLYHVILSANPDHEQLIPIFAAILVLPDCDTYATPAVIEQVLGLPSGQVALTLRGMYSVLKVLGPEDGIGLYHTSFEEYLVDHTRSCDFYIDIPAWKHIIAHRWMQSLTIDRLRSSMSNGCIFDLRRFDSTGWIRLCESIPQPTWDLLHDLWSIDLATVFSLLVRGGIDRYWQGQFKELSQWVEKYPPHAEIGHDDGQLKQICSADVADNHNKQYVRHVRSPSPNHPSHANTVKRGDVFHRTIHGWNGIDLVEALRHRLRNLPTCFHLECSPGVEPQQKHVYRMVEYATDWLDQYLDSKIDWSQNPLLLSECHCDLSGGHESHHPQHVAYQDACMRYARALTSEFAEIAPGAGQSAQHDSELGAILCNLVGSALLKHCRLDTELLSLCRTFFELVKGFRSVFVWIQAERKWSKRDGRANLLEWIETFPEKFAEEGRALKSQVLSLPWVEEEDEYYDEEDECEDDEYESENHEDDKGMGSISRDVHGTQ